ncbi:MAG: aminomethyl-transferring glycine dehydrogenase subunit GcvPA [Oscillospiraceae bacterium]|nr:aminomethyl-transferring glycine dehydrogenase subunit GcvPA [Oscillospiraceae bacterium]
MGSYVPSTLAQRREMLEAVGCCSMEELFGHLPQQVLLDRPLHLARGLSELEVRRAMEAIASRNTVFSTVFRGAGAYRHYIPAIVKQVVSKEEFVTSYTPYQAEISQGVLQSIFEYQTMICELTGMDVSNASVYDGSTAAAEAVAMCQDRKRVKTLLSAAAHPDLIQTVKTYCEGSGMPVEIIPAKDGKTDLDALHSLLDDSVCCVLIQQPNYWGQLEDADQVGALAHESGAKYIMSCNPISLGMLQTPAESGADIAVGDGQPLGLSLSFGGPYLGFMACTNALIRKIPGRIVGETTDVDGKRAYVLTLQAREQHIRREKASSNICSNQALCALTASVYLAAMGANGLENAAAQSFAKAHYFAKEMAKIPGCKRRFSGEFFHEFVAECPDVPKAMAALEAQSILGGLPLNGDLSGCVLWCATEQNSKEEIDRAIAVIKEVCGA